MRIISVINAKGGCGKSTIAMSLAAGLGRRGKKVLLVDMDPQAQITLWLNAGDGLSIPGSLLSAFLRRQTLQEVIQKTALPGVSFVASTDALEEFGRRVTEDSDYATLFARLLMDPGFSAFDFAVIDSPNQISPIMENAIFATDLFVAPFESTKSVRSYANFFKLVLKLRPEEDYLILHVLSNLSRQPGLRTEVLQVMISHGIWPARTEVRSCGWLARVDEHGGSIFRYRPHSHGAEDMAALTDEVLSLFKPVKMAPLVSKRPVK